MDREVLLDMLHGSSHYRLLWRGEAISEADAHQIVGLVLHGAWTGGPGESRASGSAPASASDT